SWTGAHNYSWGPDGLVYDSAGSTIYTPGLSQQAGGVDRYPLHDWLGSTRYLTDSSQVVKSALRFDAYGNRSLTGGTDPYDPSDFQFGAGWGYQTEYASSTEPGLGLGLQLLGERYYGYRGLLPSGLASARASASPRLASRNGSAVSRCEKKVMELCP